ncbi:MAG: AraC family transcriptional regulator [Oscillospiraceae bacterium]|nr:AraC family transcriptional regulator [Oscillospiraceae bacterium]
MQSIRIYEMPDCQMVSSGKGMFGEEKFDRFEKWLSSQKRSLFPKDFFFGGEDGFTWLYMLEGTVNVPSEFEIVNFKGGLYAVATDIDQKTDTELMNAEVNKILSENGFERDTLRKDLGNIITSHAAREIMGYEQMDYYFPIKAKNN